MIVLYVICDEVKIYSNERHRNATTKPKFLEQVRTILRTRLCSLRTKEVHLGWSCRFVSLHGRRHQQEMGGTEMAAFLNYLAGERVVAAAIQNQARNALLFPFCASLRTLRFACAGDLRQRKLSVMPRDAEK